MLTLGCQVMLTNEGTVPFPGFPQLFEYSFSQIWALNSFKESFGDRKRYGCPCSPTILPLGWMSLAVATGTEVLTISPEPRVPAQDAGRYRQCRFLFHPQSHQPPDLSGSHTSTQPAAGVLCRRVLTFRLISNTL